MLQCYTYIFFIIYSFIHQCFECSKIFATHFYKIRISMTTYPDFLIESSNSVLRGEKTFLEHMIDLCKYKEFQGRKEVAQEINAILAEKGENLEG